MDMSRIDTTLFITKRLNNIISSSKKLVYWTNYNQLLLYLEKYFGNTEDSFDAVMRFEKMIDQNISFFFEWSTYDLIIQYYMEKELYDKALCACQYALEQHPYSFEVYFEKAQIYLELAKPQEALSAIEYGQKMQPTDIELMTLKGSTLIQLELYDQAINCFEYVLNFSLNKTEILYQLGVCYECSGDVEQAIHCFKQTIAENPRHENALFELATCLEISNKLEESVKYYQEFIDQDPFSASAWYNMGVLYDRLEKFDEAINAYEYAIAIEADFSSAYFNIGLTYLEQQEFQKAIDSFVQTLKLEGDTLDEKLHLCLAHSYFQLDRYQEALKHYHLVIKINQSQPEAWFGVGACLFHQKKWHEAAHFYMKATKLQPQNATYWQSKAKSEYLVGNYLSSIQSYEKASELDATNIQIWLEWSFLLYEDKKIKEAKEIITRALDENPDSPELLYRKTAYLIAQGDYKEAFMFLEMAITLDFEKHTLLLEFFTELSTQKALMKLIDQLKEGDVQ